MRLTKMRVVTAAGVLALAGGVAALTGTAAAAAAGQPATSAQAPAEVSSPHPGDLYFVSASGEYIMRLPLAGGKPQRVVKVGEVSVTGIAISGNRLFWVTQDGEGGSLDYVT